MPHKIGFKQCNRRIFPLTGNNHREYCNKRLRFVSLLVLSLVLSGCQSFQKDRDLELYLVGGALTYAAAKSICRKSAHAEKCGVGAAAAFIVWY